MCGALKQAAGFSLIEGLITLVILAVLLGIGLPSIKRMNTSLKQQAISNGIEQYLQNSRQIAASHNKRISLTIKDNYPCIGRSEFGQCDCQTKGSCQINGQEHVFDWSNKDIRLLSNSAKSLREIHFSPRLGIAVGSNGSFSLQSAFEEIKVIVSALGRTRLCALKSRFQSIPTC